MSAGHRRNRKGEGPRLRDDLLDAVTELLARSGDAGAVTIRAVAARAGVSPPAVYLHFPDRDSLLRTAISRRFDEFSARLSAVTDGVDPEADVLAAAHAYVAFGQAEPGTYRALFSTVDAGPGGLGLRPSSSTWSPPLWTLAPTAGTHGPSPCSCGRLSTDWSTCRSQSPKSPGPTPTSRPTTLSTGSVSLQTSAE
jgi:AcrR family transcriptional regulator